MKKLGVKSAIKPKENSLGWHLGMEIFKFITPKEIQNYRLVRIKETSLFK